MIAQWSVEQEILRTTIHFGAINAYLIFSAINSKKNTSIAWKSPKIILLRFCIDKHNW